MNPQTKTVPLYNFIIMKNGLDKQKRNFSFDVSFLSTLYTLISICIFCSLYISTGADKENLFNNQKFY